MNNTKMLMPMQSAASSTQRIRDALGFAPAEEEIIALFRGLVDQGLIDAGALPEVIEAAERVGDDKTALVYERLTTLSSSEAARRIISTLQHDFGHDERIEVVALDPVGRSGWNAQVLGSAGNPEDQKRFARFVEEHCFARLSGSSALIIF